MIRFSVLVSALVIGCAGSGAIARCAPSAGITCGVGDTAEKASALDDRREPVRAGDRYAGSDAALREALRAARASVVYLSEVRGPRNVALSPAVGTGFLTATHCHVVTAAHVVAPTRFGDEPLMARLDRKTSPVGARVRVQADFVSDRARVERIGTVVAAGNLHRSMAEDWALIKLEGLLDAPPLALPALDTAAAVNVAGQAFIVAAFHGDLSHRRGRIELHGEVCERIADRSPGERGRVFRSYCTASPGASGGPELMLIEGKALQATGIILAADRDGIDQFFGARGVPEPLWPGRIAGLRIETVLPQLLAAIERSPCVTAR